MTKIKNKIFDVIVIGGSYSGLSAALALGRFCRDILILDHNFPTNRSSRNTQNFLTQDGAKRKELVVRTKEQILKYPSITFLTDFAIEGERTADRFLIKTEKGDFFTSKKLIFATGVQDMLPEIQGFKECWGTSVIHCPYCHGYELRNLKTVIFGSSEFAFNTAALIHTLTSDLTIVTKSLSDFTDVQLENLRHYNIRVFESAVTEIQHYQGRMNKIKLKNKNVLDAQVLYTSLPFSQSSKIPQQLGCKITDAGLISINHEQQTTISGVYACGDNSSGMRSVARAVYTGSLAGAVVNRELSKEST
ncbi:NAD(P)/FAD-dependent oxidoreductase [Chryseobacterium wangxinyae]|uniref:NAD(P)/FAD-dependent oxidoreductase n=1 Tax=Chryseobacterium sp. CY350 TaxID=2997336 RepID=UPI00226D7CBC|nr:NAD(P)/FAD-dependent oxidoreductase [Chryseobacterium sp. CY350]MCY0976934.1 NAD(P)/FAD-dependent oxidoreductase [Chryseobacterium sp. CY350]WBZ96934.1 NAD(P)/FAD-dependent oxidoreductase [Chryseobacterium sp. CY350]